MRVLDLSPWRNARVHLSKEIIMAYLKAKRPRKPALHRVYHYLAFQLYVKV